MGDAGGHNAEKEQQSSTARRGSARSLLIGASVLGSAMLTFAADVGLPLGVAGGVPYVVPVLISLRARSRWVAATASACCGLTLLGWLFSADAGHPVWIVALNRLFALLATLSVAVLGARLRHHSGQVKTLRGLIPICAQCRKVRKDDGYWQQVEAYVRDHTEADFSHGLCPGCLAVAWPVGLDRAPETGGD